MPPQEQRNQLAVELDRLADIYDAVADLLLAETVHQNVLGNHERAAAALGALDRQGRPPRVEFVRTPRTGKSYTQRLLVLIGDEHATRRHGPRRYATRRSQAEPRLNAWLARILGDPRRIRFTAAVAGRPRPSCSGSRSSGCRRSRRSWPSQAPGRDEPSELEERLRQAFLAARPPSAAAPAVDPAGRTAARATRGSSGWARSARSPAGRTPWSRPTARPPRGDLALPQDEVGDRFDEAELAARADAVADGVRGGRGAGSTRRSPPRRPSRSS